MDVVDAIAECKTDGMDRPRETQKIETVAVELNGYEPQAPIKA
jgi:hypothetical protein